MLDSSFNSNKTKDFNLLLITYKFKTMAKDKFQSPLTSTFVPLPIEDVDTDQIIPARFLKATSREGFGENLFRDWRFDQNNNPKDFILNDPSYKGAILVAGKNFGCGSSREHAAWAIADYGFKVVISSFFADIFRGNAMNIGILPIQVSDAFLNQIWEASKKNKNAELEINLEKQYVKIKDTGAQESFDIDQYKKKCLLNGFDDIDYVRSLKDKIESFEKSRTVYFQ